jgi:predicted DNA-binding protein
MADYDTPMGRPPLGVKTTVVRLPEGLAERIDDLLGPNRRAVFIRDIVEREVKRLEAERSAKLGLKPLK